MFLSRIAKTDFGSLSTIAVREDTATPVTLEILARLVVAETRVLLSPGTLLYPARKSRGATVTLKRSTLCASTTPLVSTMDPRIPGVTTVADWLRAEILLRAAA